MLQAYNYDTGEAYVGMDGPDGLELLGQSAADMDMAPVPAGMELLGYFGQSAADMDMAPVPAGMQLLGPYDIGLMQSAADMDMAPVPAGMQLLGYDMQLMAADEVVASLKVGTDVKCDAARNVCTPLNEAAKAQIMSLQSALNRAITAYAIQWKPLELDGTIGPNTITTAWTVAKKIGPEAHPVLKEISDVDITKKENIAQILALATRLATAPVGIQKVLDDLSAKAVKTEVVANGKAKKRKTIYWVLGALALAGAATGVVLYSRRPALAAR